MAIAIPDHLGNRTTSTAGLCPEMLEVARKACQVGDFNLAAEIYSSQQADLQQPDRSLCLLKADALSSAGRIAEALDTYCIATNLDRLRPDELEHLVDCITHTLRKKELCANCKETGVSDDDHQTLDLFSCHLCKCLLCEPTTLECGHTFCKRCVEEDVIKECTLCPFKWKKPNGELNPSRFRVNVVLSSLLDKWFYTESEARRCSLEGEKLRDKHDYTNALEKYNQAVETGK